MLKKPNSCFINEDNMILSTDFYQITMCAAYYQYNLENNIDEKDDIATFELFVRSLPKNRNYLIFAGLEQILHYLENIHFNERTINYLKKRDIFRNIDSSFFNEYLPNFRFKADVWSLKEGTVFFPNEPVIRVRGPSFHAQLVETYLLSVMNYQTIIASKASRIRNVAGDKVLLEFGTRRAHSPQAGIYAARASYIGGFNGTSNVVSDLELGIRSSGTMAHSFVQKYGEKDSFQIFYDYYGDNTIELIDTYDISRGAKRASKFNNKIFGVRIDSGDLAREAKKVSKILDNRGGEDVRIVLSSDLNEYKIKEILDRNAPVDAFGVGTELVTSRDDPSLNAVYKLMEYNEEPKMKISENKITYPGAKQIYRIYNENGQFKEDLMMLENEEPLDNANPQLIKMINEGKIIYDLPKLDEIRKYCLENVAKLPDDYKMLSEIDINPVRISSKLQNLTDLLKQKYIKDI